VKNSKQTKRHEPSTLGLRLWTFTGAALLNLFVFILLLVYLSPLSYMIVTSLKTRTQLQDSKAPILPATPRTFEYQGKVLDVYEVPIGNQIRDLALYDPHIKYSGFIDPSNPNAGVIQWTGYYRSLNKAYTPQITFDNYIQLWKTIKYPHV